MSGILLVHGAWHGPWCSDEFSAYLGERGHEVRAVELRGHDRPPGRIWHRLRDYVEDVRAAAAEFGEPPVLVGHSMGGLVVQKCLEGGEGAGAVLLAPPPRRGPLAAVGRLTARHPLAMLKVNLLWSLRPLVATDALVREMLYRPDTPAELVSRTGAKLQDESYPAFLDILWRWPRPARVRAPVAVFGAELDSIITVKEIEGLAAAYGTRAEIFAGIGHNLMLDEGWQAVAERVHSWVRG